MQQAIRDEVLVDVRHVADWLATHAFADRNLDIVEPYVGVEAHLRRIGARLADRPRSRVVGGQRQRGLVPGIDVRRGEVAIDLALNDPVGQWAIVATEVVSGRRVRLEVEVR